MRLEDLPDPYASRVASATDPVPWAVRCITPHAAQWIAWNVREDTWYGTAELDLIRIEIDAADPSLTGPALLTRCAAKLQRLVLLPESARRRLPLGGFNHVAATRFSRRYELAPESAWAEGSIPGEIDYTLPPGTEVRVVARAGPSFAWLAFEAGGKQIPRDADDTMRHLGLPWNSSGGTVVRVRVPIAFLYDAGIAFALPTLFDVLHDGPYALEPDWRARPQHEQRIDEPWGHTRDMQDDGPGLPEVIADIKPAGTMDAECIGVPLLDWSQRPFLRGSAPR